MVEKFKRPLNNNSMLMLTKAKLKLRLHYIFFSLNLQSVILMPRIFCGKLQVKVFNSFSGV